MSHFLRGMELPAGDGPQIVKNWNTSEESRYYKQEKHRKSNMFEHWHFFFCPVIIESSKSKVCANILVFIISFSKFQGWYQQWNIFLNRSSWKGRSRQGQAKPAMNKTWKALPFEFLKLEAYQYALRTAFSPVDSVDLDVTSSHSFRKWVKEWNEWR